MMRRGVIGGGVVAITAVAAGIALLADGDDDGSSVASRSLAVATARIVQRDLIERERVDGTLGYADARPASAFRAGTVTWVPALGDTVRPGHRLFQVDRRSVFLFDGTVPAYRALGAGDRGTDVRQVQATLRDLGFDAGGALRVDGSWDARTTEAVVAWQRDRGLDPTGRLALGDVVFAPGARRVTSVAVRLGATIGTAGGGAAAGAAAGGNGVTVLTTTSVRRIVVVELDAAKQAIARDGAPVRVTLPDDRRVTGRIVRVGRVARVAAAGSGAAEASADPTVKLTIRLTGAGRTTLDQAPVEVELERERARDALAVPVTALIARTGGGFAVEVRDGARRELVPVEIGLSTDSMVQVRGRGLRAGLLVADSRV